MRILVVHNRYQHRGGEDSVFESEVSLLRSYGHEVRVYSRTNDDIPEIPLLSLAGQTVWSKRTGRDIADLVSGFNPDVIHAHNTFPLVSPSLYWAAAKAGVPVVQTLHNFRFLCLSAFFLRDSKACEDCLGRLPWRGVRHGCYRRSYTASATLAATLTLHRALGTYRSHISRYIALNEFCRKKFIEGGLPAERIAVKPNFVDFPPFLAQSRQGFLFAGRLSVEKGVKTLSRAKALLPHINLLVAGEGPEASELEDIEGLTLLGQISRDEVRQEMSRAVALVVPSMSEPFGLVVVEAFAASTPVIASRIEPFTELIKNGENGLLFEPGNPRDLADKIIWASAHQEQMVTMGQRARLCYESRYTPEVNYKQLLAIYHEAIDEVKKSDA